MITTVTTVGYGDITPITPLGRLVAVFTMFSGIIIVGSLSTRVSPQGLGALGSFWVCRKAPEIQQRSKEAPSDTQSSDGPSFSRQFADNIAFSYIFTNAPGRKGAGWRVARRNVGATGEEL